MKRGAISQFEKEKIMERTSRGRQKKAKIGKMPLAFKPYGYDYDPETSRLVVHQEEAQVGIPAKKGGQWHRNVVRQILLNPVYTAAM